MSIDELSVMDGSKCILQLRGVRPFLSDKYDITAHKNYRYLADFDDKNFFNMEQFVNRKLEIKPDDEFVMVEHDAQGEEMPAEAYADYTPEDNDDADDFSGFDPTDTELV
jgi:hypothetical protein